MLTRFVPPNYSPPRAEVGCVPALLFLVAAGLIGWFGARFLGLWPPGGLVVAGVFVVAILRRTVSELSRRRVARQHDASDRAAEREQNWYHRREGDD